MSVTFLAVEAYYTVDFGRNIWSRFQNGPFQNASKFRNMVRAWSCWYLQYSLNIALFTGNKIRAIRRMEFEIIQKKTKRSLKNVPCIWLHVEAINISFSRYFSVFRREKTPFWDKEWCDQKNFIEIKSTKYIIGKR